MQAPDLLEIVHQLGNLSDVEALAIEIAIDQVQAPHIASVNAFVNQPALDAYALSWDMDAMAEGNDSARYSLEYRWYCDRAAEAGHDPELRMDLLTFVLVHTIHHNPACTPVNRLLIAQLRPDLAPLLEDTAAALFLAPERPEDEPEERSEPEEARPVTIHRITVRDDDSAYVESSTDDDQDRGYSGYAGCDAHWDMEFRTLDAALAVTGYTRAGVLSDVNVYIGQDLYYGPSAQA